MTSPTIVRRRLSTPASTIATHTNSSPFLVTFLSSLSPLLPYPFIPLLISSTFSILHLFYSPSSYSLLLFIYLISLPFPLPSPFSPSSLSFIYRLTLSSPSPPSLISCLPLFSPSPPSLIPLCLPLLSPALPYPPLPLPPLSLSFPFPCPLPWQPVHGESNASRHPFPFSGFPSSQGVISRPRLYPPREAAKTVSTSRQAR